MQRNDQRPPVAKRIAKADQQAAFRRGGESFDIESAGGFRCESGRGREAIGLQRLGVREVAQEIDVGLAHGLEPR